MPRITSPRRAITRAAASLAPLLVCAPLSAGAVEVAFRYEPGVAIALTRPQSKLYEAGAGQSLKAMFGLTPWLDVGPTGTMMFLPPEAANTESGVAWGLGAGARLKRPHDQQTFAGVSPWIDADLLYVRTGDLNRPGFDAAVGLSFPIGEARAFWVGPFLRYMQIIQPDRVGYDNHDAKLLTVGISFEVGTAARRAPSEQVVLSGPAVSCPNACPDRDQDGVPDVVDRCPDKAGVSDNYGCPAYKKLIVRADKLELKEKLYFAWDQAVLEDASFPVLDDVVQALVDNPNFRVQIEGHTDSSGADDHNQTLSEKRAEAVLDYLVAHGVPKDRLVSKGFAASVPLDTNNTVAGRENNRRVEFVVQFKIVDRSAH